MDKKNPKGAVNKWLDKAKGQLGEKLEQNEQFQQLQEDPRYQQFMKHGPLIYQVVVCIVFVLPLLTMMAMDSCYAMDRPNYFWPVRKSAQDTKDFTVYNMSARFIWIFIIGMILHIVQVLVDKYDDYLEDQREVRAIDQEKHQRTLDMKEKKLKYGLIGLFVIRITYFLWVWSTRYSHQGKVCSGDYNDFDVVRRNSNFTSGFDYTFLSFPGWMLKVYLLIFTIRLIVKAIVAIWYDTDFDPTDKDRDDDYERMSGDKRGRSSGPFSGYSDDRSESPRGRSSQKWSEGQHRKLYDSPGKPDKKSPDQRINEFERGTSANTLQNNPMFSAQRTKKKNTTDFENKIQQQIRESMLNKQEAKDFSTSNKRVSSKKQLQKQQNALNKR